MKDPLPNALQGSTLLKAGDDVYDRLSEEDELEVVCDVADAIRRGEQRFAVRVAEDWTFVTELELTDRERKTLLSGGKLAEINREAVR